jgi:hypothetical protein
VRRPPRRLLAPHRADPDGIGHRSAGEVLHDDERPARAAAADLGFEVADVEDRHHVGVRRYPGRRPRLTLEAAHRGVVVGEALGQDLHRDRPSEDQILGAPHRRHATAGQVAAGPVSLRELQGQGLRPGLPARTH